LIQVIVRGFALMSSAWFVAMLMRRRSASLRAGVWTMAFASLLALPAIARVTPSWKIAVLPAVEVTTASVVTPLRQEEAYVARPVHIRFTDAVAVPAVIGVWRPTLLLPLDAGGWTSEARRVVILHELAHVARWDAFDQLVTEAGCALYWIVPPVWIAARSAAA